MIVTLVWKSFLYKVEGMVGLDLGQAGLESLEREVSWSTSVRRTRSLV